MATEMLSEKRFLTKADVIDYLGYSRATLARLLAEGKIPRASLFPGTKRQRWRRAVIDDWVKRQERENQRA